MRGRDNRRFRLAEVDLNLRGPASWRVHGVGIPEFRVAI